MSGVCRACIPPRGVACHRERANARRQRALPLSPSSFPPSRRAPAPVRAGSGADLGATENGDGGGVVHLIGAGPGGLDNLTVRALRLLRTCDVLVGLDTTAHHVTLQSKHTVDYRG